MGALKFELRLVGALANLLRSEASPVARKRRANSHKKMKSLRMDTPQLHAASAPPSSLLWAYLPSPPSFPLILQRDLLSISFSPSTFSP
jgi:hypothetical protein